MINEELPNDFLDAEVSIISENSPEIG